MTLQYGDRVQETTVTSGTSDYALDGAVIAYQPFSNVMDDGDTCFYGITDQVNWEVGLGTYDAGANSIERTTILASSNAGSPVDWASNLKNIWLDVPANYFIANSKVREVTTPGTITQIITDKVIVVQNNASGLVQVDLMPADEMPENAQVTIKDGTGSVNVQINPAGLDTIDDANTVTFQYQRQWITLAPIDGGWTVIG